MKQVVLEVWLMSEVLQSILSKFCLKVILSFTQFLRVLFASQIRFAYISPSVKDICLNFILNTVIMMFVIKYPNTCT